MKQFLTFPTLLLLFLLVACGSEPRPYMRSRLPQDTLKYLCDNSDLIALVETELDSQQHDKGQSPLYSPSLFSVRIIRVFKGDERSGSNIVITCNPFINPPGVIASQIAVYSGTYVVFLKNVGEHYLPLTDESLVYVDGGKVTPIWQRKPGVNVQHESVSLEAIVEDIVRATGSLE